MDHRPDVSFDLVFRPSELTAVVRQFVATFYSNVLTNPQAVSNLVVVTHELLENTVKYGIDGETRLCVELDRKTGQVVIRVWNRAEAAHLAILAKMVQDLNDAPDPFQHYMDLMRSSAQRANGSGLGLARIYAEADMSLGVHVAEDMVCITARGQVGGAA
jgi:hypothetical protein